MGGSRIAVGSSHIELKSLVTPRSAYTSGVDALEIDTQPARSPNNRRSDERQSVRMAKMTATATHAAIGVATYQRNSGGSCHQGQSRTITHLLRRLVRDEAGMLHRSVRDTCCCLLVAAHRK
jgi:hypothetical protein